MSGVGHEAALQDWLLTPRADMGFSPTFMFFGRTPRGWLPYVQNARSIWLLTPRADMGFSPTFMFFGRTPRGRLPYVQNARSIQEAESAQEQSMSCEPHVPACFSVGNTVLGQYMKTKQWSMHGTVMAVQDNGQSYLINFRGARENLRKACYFPSSCQAGVR